MAQLNGLSYEGLFGICQGSKTLAGRDSPLYPLQLYSLSKSIHAQGAPTWGALIACVRKWGTGGTLRYSQADSSLTYTWDVPGKTFTVTDASGKNTVYPDINCINDLGCSWAIMKSLQFFSKRTDFTGGDIFIVCSRLETPRVSYQLPAGLPLQNDYLADGTQHAVFNYLCSLVSYMGNVPLAGYGDEPPIFDAPTENTAFDVALLVTTILLSKAENLQATNVFTPDLLGTDPIKSLTRDKIAHNGLSYTGASLLMVAAISSLLLDGDKPVFEPWMLWKAYQWYSNVTHGKSNSRRIFDLSPRWG